MDSSKQCSVEGCEKGGKMRRGLCEMHYRRWRLYGEVGTPGPIWPVRHTCVVDGCDGLCQGHGYCAKHYMRWRKHGDPLAYLPQKTPAEIRFRRHFKSGPVPGYAPHLGRCWLWTAAMNPEGYGVFSECGAAHRFSYELYVGPVPEGLHIDHLCRVRNCVNPDHLEPVTPAENARRSSICPSTINSAKTHCPQGHEYTPENTYRKPGSGYRECRECNRRNQRARREAQ